MKIGILSLPMTWNYGGILQYYALQELFKSLGYETTIICHRKKRNNIIIQNLVKFKWYLIPKISNYGLLKGNPLIDVESFKAKYLDNQSKPLFNSNDLQNYVATNHIKLMVVGSDQVWNKWAIPDLYSFYLNFCENINNLKRIAFSASFAKMEFDYTNDEVKRCKELLMKFDLISVRESIGVEHCKNYFGLDAELFPDPTLFFNNDFYTTKIIEPYKKKFSNENYLFTYILDINDEKLNIINQVSKEINVDVKSLPKYQSKLIFGKSYNSVEEWLLSIKNSKFVLTDSYHGMLFSIIFKKDFYVFVNKKRGAERFYTVAKKLGLENRLLESANEYIDIHLKIDWKSVHTHLDTWVEFSKEKLKGVLNAK